jgi:Family of unknown function (DUF5670)
MLVIIGMILLLTWIFEHAFHLTADSLINLLLIFASISFALDFLRERDRTELRPGWDDRPPRSRIGSIGRWLRHRLNPSPVPVETPTVKPSAGGKGSA